VTTIVIWCEVVDHFGDAAICWRLATNLATALAQDNSLNPEVVLAIDHPEVLRQLVPELSPILNPPSLDGVRVVDWSFPATEIDVMISTFGCRLPNHVLESMGEQEPPPVWINLEHLTPQSWTGSCHTLVSPNRTNGLDEIFFFPGFDPSTGGLLREPGLLEARDRFHADPRERDRFLAVLGIEEADRKLPAVLVFGYPDAPVDALIETLANGPPMLLLLPSSPAPTIRQENVRIHAFGWVAQQDFDRLLWSCMAAFVRGEDSLVRAHWAAIPFIWQPYRQADQSHREQLEAWLARWHPFLPEAAATAQASLAQAWDCGEPANLSSAWNNWLAHRPELSQGAADWSRQLAAGPSLIQSLSAFLRDRLESRSTLSHRLRHSRLDSR
jgi:uncharacterized repeat protein (TIGR03837 family)